uniref:carboxylesterase n=1 Tax=Glossina brevipalpis TaxID=37001 RepID=A0A1A9WL65_9MUSC
MTGAATGKVFNELLQLFALNKVTIAPAFLIDSCDMKTCRKYLHYLWDTMGWTFSLTANDVTNFNVPRFPNDKIFEYHSIQKRNISQALPECDTGISNLYGPDLLLDYDIILVSTNNRLDSSGFLSTESLDCPGNFGLKDQQEILKSIQTNIEAFGCSLKSVTIFEESASGACVTYHMLLPISQGHFNKGIAQSDHEEASLITHPRDEMQPHGLSLPLMIGTTSDEGLLKTAALLNLKDILYEFKTKFKQILLIIFYYDHLPQ